MSKRVLSVGQCSMDHGARSTMLESTFALKSVPAETAADALVALGHEKFDLVMVNRKLDADYSDGIEIIRQIKADPQLAATPCMLVTNYPEHQEAAVAAGAELGFGKQGYHAARKLRRMTESVPRALSCGRRHWLERDASHPSAVPRGADIALGGLATPRGTIRPPEIGQHSRAAAAGARPWWANRDQLSA